MSNELHQKHASKDRSYHAVIAGEYEQVVNEPRAYPNELLFQPLDRQLPRHGEAMLDLGCGTGQMLRRYAGRFKRIIGVDHSPEMLAVARRSLDKEQQAKTRLLQSDLLEFLATDSNSYDLVSIVGCLHHLHPDDLGHVVRQAARRLSPGGCMLLAEPLQQENMDPPRAISQWNRSAIAGLPGYSTIVEEPDEAPIDESRMFAVIQDAGLRIKAQSRGWELFPRHLPASLFDRIRLRSLHRKYGDSGYVHAMLLEQVHD